MSTIEDFLLTHLSIHVTGPSFPHRPEPLKCYIPLHRSYPGAPPCRPNAWRGAPRNIGEAVVYDKDMVTTWRLGGGTMRAYEIFFWEKALEAAVGQEVLGIVVEGWMREEENPEDLSSIALLRSIGDYISHLGTQPVTLPLSTLVAEMLDSYHTLTPDLEPFSWATATPFNHLPAILESFIRSQEIFFYPSGHEPVLEIRFSVLKWRTNGLDVEFYISWNPVLANFEGLSNQVTEGRDFRIKPTFSVPSNLPPEASRLAPVPTTSSFADDIRGCLVGRAPEMLAGLFGAEREDGYVVGLQFEGRLAWHFPGDVRLEKCVRVVVPLEVRRGRSSCGVKGIGMLSPPLRDAVRGLRERSMRQGGLIGRRRVVLGPAGTTVPVKKENMNGLSNEEVHKLLVRKTEEAVNPAASPTRLNNPLSLAQFHDAIGLHRPPPEMRNVQVRTVHTAVKSPSPVTSPKYRQLPGNSPLAEWFEQSRIAKEEQIRPAAQQSSDASPTGRSRIRTRTPEQYSDDCQIEDTKGLPGRYELGESSRTTARTLTLPKNAKERGQSDLPIRERFPDQYSAAGKGENLTVDTQRANAEDKMSCGPLDFAHDTSAALRSSRDLDQPTQDSTNSVIQKWRTFARQPPFPAPAQSTLQDQKSLIQARFFKQAELYASQLERAERFGRSLDVEAILRGEGRVDEMDPKDLGISDSRGKLREWEAEAEQLEMVGGRELAEMSARVWEGIEPRSSVALAENIEKQRNKHGGALVYADPKEWQRAIQANHKELNERKEGFGKTGDGADEETENWGPKEKLDVTMVDVIDSDEAEDFEDGSGSGSDGKRSSD